jgi:hypothetical protein
LKKREGVTGRREEGKILRPKTKNNKKTTKKVTGSFKLADTYSDLFLLESLLERLSRSSIL